MNNEHLDLQLNREIAEVQKLIRSSKIGETLDKTERWSRFRDNESTKEWLKLLGPTAIVLSHQEFFVEFVRLWMGNNWSSEEKRDILLALQLHDLGEATVGDISAYFKTEKVLPAEDRAGLENIKKLGADPTLESELIRLYSQVVVGENAALHYIFKAFERTEYLNTAITVFDRLISGYSMTKGWNLIADVLASDLPKVITYAEKMLDTIGLYLKVNKEKINSMFSESFRHVEGENGPRRQKLTDSKRLWDDFLRKNLQV